MGPLIFAAIRSGRTTLARLLRSGLGIFALCVTVATSPSSAADRLDLASEYVPPMAQERLGDAIESSLDSRPRIHGALSSRSIRNLRLGFVLALEKVRSTPECHALFAPLAGSGAEKLATTHYAATTSQGRAGVCAGGVAAFTTVGGRVTWLCPEFGNLNPRAAALTLIHEALHSAGMPERPATAGALSAHEINDLVEAACVAAPAGRGAGEVIARRP